MLFNSIQFAIFLPVTFILYWFVFNRSLRLRNLFLLAASYLFYGWWDYRFLGLIAFTSMCSFAGGVLIERFAGSGRRKAARLTNAANIVVNLGILCAFKYYDFFAGEFAAAFLPAESADDSSLFLGLILPVGISFYTFQALSYTIDVCRGKLAAERDPVAFFTYIAFFPQLVAGPIERATNLLPQFAVLHRFDRAAAADGCRQILWGMFKKVAVADNCAVIVNAIFADYADLPGSTLWLGAILFAIQIYCDFSGYSDIAVGTARLFGFRLMRNFNVPYFSRDIAEFWRRWHISLTAWFRDYIYIPLGGSRVSKAKIIRNTFVIFLVSGLWHGANWTFLAWGAYHALLFLPLILAGKNRKYTDVAAQNRMLPSLQETGRILTTFMLAVIGWVIFRAESIADAANYLGGMFSASAFDRATGFGSAEQLRHCIWFSAALFVVEWIQRKQNHGLDFGGRGIPFVARLAIYYAVMFAFMYAGPVESFIYFQF